MNFRYLECFSSLCKYLNFTRAAEEQYISQPTMTQYIHSLEDELEVKLLDRNSRNVKLTNAGECFLKYTNSILELYNQAKADVQALERANTNTIILGYNGPTEQGFLPELLNNYIKSNKTSFIKLRKNKLNSLIVDLLSKKVDIIFSNIFEVKDFVDVSYYKIFESTPCVAVPKDHPLTNKKKLTLKDIQGEQYIAWSSYNSFNEISKSHKVLASGGIDFSNAIIVNSIDEVLEMVEIGIGISPTSTCYKNYHSDKISYIDLELDVEPMDIVVAWLKENNNQAVHNLIEFIKKYNKFME